MYTADPRPLLPRLATRLGPFFVPVLVCLGVLSVPVARRPQHAPVPTPARHLVRSVTADTAAELQDLLSTQWATTEDEVPALAPDRFPADLDQLSVSDRKEVFFRSLLPHVLDHNTRILEDRVRVREVGGRASAGGSLPENDIRFLGELADRYRLGTESADVLEQVRVLLRRVDVVPPSIALAQAAIESAWGTSRFTRLGNNLFGQWVFDRDRGIAPLERPEGANYSLARFSGLGDAVDAYLRNLNGFYAYGEFRRLRREMRATGGPLDPYRLANGLSSYSTRRGEYVREVRSVIRGNNLTRYDQARLATPATTSAR